MHFLLEYAARNNTRVILSGDTRQHHAVDRGDALRVLEQHGTVRSCGLTTIFRQKVQALREAISELALGKTLAGFDRLEEAQVIHEVEDKKERLNEITALHLAAIRENKSSLIVAPTHAECRIIVEATRNALRKEGLLRGEDHICDRLQSIDLSSSQRSDPINYHPGELVEFHRKTKDFKKGERWEITGVTEGAVEVVKDGQARVLPLSEPGNFGLYRRDQISLAVGDTVRITKNFRAPAGRFRNNELCTVAAIDKETITLTGGRTIRRGNPIHLDQGIAVTSHAAQGKTVNQVIVSAPVASFTQVNQAQFYVSMSRARHAMHLFTDSKVALREAVTRKSERLSPLALTLAKLAWNAPSRSDDSSYHKEQSERNREYER